MTLEEVYALVPAIECKGLCSRSCGVIFCEPLEAKRVGGRTYILTSGTFKGAAKMLAASGKQADPAVMRMIESLGDTNRDIASLGADKKKRCAKLKYGRCTVYENRPLICRLWGVVESMPCHMGCVPERWLTHEEGHELLALARKATS